MVKWAKAKFPNDVTLSWISIDDNLEHPENKSTGISVIFWGIVKVVKLEQCCWKETAPNDVTLSWISIDDKLEHERNKQSEILVTFGGIEKLRKFLQLWNA